MQNCITLYPGATAGKVDDENKYGQQYETADASSNSDPYPIRDDHLQLGGQKHQQQQTVWLSLRHLSVTFSTLVMIFVKDFLAITQSSK
jgi:hypothetical protein